MVTGSSVADCNSRDSTEPIPTTTMNPYYSPYPTFHSTDVAVPTSTTMFTTIISHLATPTEQPVTSLATNHTVIAAVFGVVIVLVVVVSVATLFIFIRCWPSSSSSPKCTQINEFQVSPREEKTKLLVLYSWGTSELSQRHILQCLSPLTYDTDLVYSAKANIRGDIPQWVEKHINKSDKVLIICNEEFDAEWRSPGATHTEGAIVNALKAIINGHVNNGTMDIICCKFALVFLKENHKKLVPSGILHSFKQYVLHVEDSERQEELFRFILDTPLFQFCHDTEDQLKVV